MSATLKQVRQACAREIGPFAEVVTTQTSDAATAVYSTALNHSGYPVSAFDGSWIYVTASTLADVVGRQGQVIKDGYLNTNGRLSLSTSLNGLTPSGSTFELHGRVPPIAQYGSKGWRELANEALRDLWLADHRIAVATQDGIYSYDLSAYPWLIRPDRLEAVLDPPPLPNRPPRETWRTWMLRRDGASLVLDLNAPYPANTTFYLKIARRPADTLINGADSTTGLVSDADTTPLELDDVVTVTLLHAYRWLAARAPEQRAAYWRQMAAEQEARARRIAQYETHEPPAPEQAAAPAPVDPRLAARNAARAAYLEASGQARP
jgi:hypothetical protein